MLMVVSFFFITFFFGSQASMIDIQHLTQSEQGHATRGITGLSHPFKLDATPYIASPGADIEGRYHYPRLVSHDMEAEETYLGYND